MVDGDVPGGVPARRVRGVRVERLVSVAPAPPVETAPAEEEDYAYLLWLAQWGGTLPEYKCFHWLESRGYKVFEDFYFQASRMGGRQMAGGAVVDFEFPVLRLAWRVQGEKWHVGDPAKEATDEIQKLNLMQIGYTVVDIFAQDALERTNWVCSNAIQGVQVRELH